MAPSYGALTRLATVHCDSLNQVQKRLLRLISVRGEFSFTEVDRLEIATQYQIISLTSRRMALDFIFFLKIINGLTALNCSSCFSMFLLVLIITLPCTATTVPFFFYGVGVFGQSLQVFRRLELSRVTSLVWEYWQQTFSFKILSCMSSLVIYFLSY